MAEQDGMQWIGTWTTTPAPVEGRSLGNQTLRMIAHTSIGGPRLRVRLSNAYGMHDLLVGSAHVALRAAGSEIVSGSDRALTFNGSTSIAIPAGALVVSDAVELEVPPSADLAVSIYLPRNAPESFQVTGHGNAHQTNYISTPGDFTSDPAMSVGEVTTAFLFLNGIDVLAGSQTGGIVTVGDSLTDCNISRLDANNRWPDQLARRLIDRRGGRQLGVMNQGIGGNRILHDVRGESGLRRFDRDVLAQPGVTHVIVLLGINDIRNREQKPEEHVSADEMISGLHQMTVRAHSAGLKILGGTLLTFEHETFNPGFYTPEGEEKRQAVNAWIRGSDAFDAVIDFEKALRDPSHPTQMLPKYDCGDHLHPSDAGYLHMGEIIDLALFD
jgi:lysophospholipase L1-like esterase